MKMVTLNAYENGGFECQTEGMMRGKKALVWCVITNLDPLKRFKKDFMSLKRCSVDESEWSNQL